MNINTPAGLPTAAPLVLHSAPSGEGTPLPLGLSGLPTEVDGVKVHYRKMKIARAGNWTHRGTGEPVDISAQRMDEWVRNTSALSAAGVKPFLPGQHRGEFNAADNHGYVLGLAREGDDLYATVQLFGDDAQRIAALNGRSIYVVKDARDARGNVFAGESIAHVALVPNPALPDLGPTVRIAASADGSAAIEAPVIEPAAESQRSNPMFKPETRKNLLAKLKLPDNTPDAEVAEKTAALALADPPADKAAEVTALSADKTRLEGELAAERNKVLSLSAQVPKPAEQPNALSLSLIGRAFKTDREQVIASGVISEAGMKEIDTLLGVGQPQGVALSLSAGSTDPLYTRLLNVIRKNPGIKTGNAVAREGVSVATQIALSSDGAEKPDLGRIAAEAMAKEVARTYAPTAVKLGVTGTPAAA